MSVHYGPSGGLEVLSGKYTSYITPADRKVPPWRREGPFNDTLARRIVSLFSKGADGPARTARRPGYPPVKGLYQPFKMTY